MSILITGFEPFAGLETNPSIYLAEHIARQHNWQWAQLPVRYQAIDQCLKDLLTSNSSSAFKAVVLLGLHRGESFRLEQIAINQDHSQASDNDGIKRIGQCIDPSAPQTYLSTLPLQAIAHLLQEQLQNTTTKHNDTVWSMDAGGYLCNHAFFMSRHLLVKNDRAHIPCGFIHVPSFDLIDACTQTQALGNALKSSLQ